MTAVETVCSLMTCANCVQRWAVVWCGGEGHNAVFWVVESEHPDWNGWQVSGGLACPKCGGYVTVKNDLVAWTEAGWVSVGHTDPVYADWVRRN